MDKKINLNLDEELSLLQHELVENEKLFSQVKTHYDRIMDSKSSGSLKFVTDQTGNVMNLRNNRINIIKEMINVKKLKAEMEIKEMNLNKDSGNGDDQALVMAKKVYELMKTDSREGNIAHLLNKTNSIEAKKEAIANEQEVVIKAKEEEDLLKQRMIEIQAKKNEAKKEKEIKERGYLFACDMQGKVYAINKEGTEILEDIEIPEFEIEFEEDSLTGLTIAKNQFGDILDIIEIA